MDKNMQELKNYVRHPYAWPGGYEIAFITDDGGILCHDCVRKNFKEVLWSTKHAQNDGWRIVGYAMEAVDPETTREMAGEDYISYCAHCGKEFGEMG